MFICILRGIFNHDVVLSRFQSGFNGVEIRISSFLSVFCVVVIVDRNFIICHLVIDCKFLCGMKGIICVEYSTLSQDLAAHVILIIDVLIGQIIIAHAVLAPRLSPPIISLGTRILVEILKIFCSQNLLIFSALCLFDPGIIIIHGLNGLLRVFQICGDKILLALPIIVDILGLKLRVELISIIKCLLVLIHRLSEGFQDRRKLVIILRFQRILVLFQVSRNRTGSGPQAHHRFSHGSIGGCSVGITQAVIAAVCILQIVIRISKETADKAVIHFNVHAQLASTLGDSISKSCLIIACSRRGRVGTGIVPRRLGFRHIILPLFDSLSEPILQIVRSHLTSSSHLSKLHPGA